MSEVSSVGPTWPPEKTSQERVRGFYPRIIEGDSDIDTLIEAMGATTDTLGDDNITRLAFRAVTRVDQLKTLDGELAGSSMGLEAAIPIQHPELDNHSIAYLGANTPQRSIATEHYSAYAERIRRTSQQPRTYTDGTLELKIVDPRNAAQLVAPFTELYQPFGYNEEETADILKDPGNIIAYINQKGRPVSTAMAEQASIPTEAGEVNITELTEASTLPQLRGAGLYTLCVGGLVRHIKHSQNTNALYGESNLSTDRVIHAAHQTGRRFSHNDASGYSIDSTGFGILPQNFSVNDGVETRRYNDFAVGYYEL